MFSTITKRSLLLAITLLGLLSGCAGLPHYAQPHISPIVGPLPENVVTYRDLNRKDFQAMSLPDHIKEYSKRLNAHTAVSIRPVSQSKYIVSSTYYNGHKVYSGYVEQLVFEAVMIPDRSWWNLDAPKNRERYILQHEQIHFALMERSARKLTEKAAAESASLIAFDSSYDAARKSLVEIVGNMIKESQLLSLHEHTMFDEETSQFYSPKDQQRWYDEVTKWLEENPKPTIPPTQ